MNAAADIVLYRPSCGSEGADFAAAWCSRCRRDADAEHGDGCPILADTFVYSIDDGRYPREWREDGPSGPRCTAFEAAEEGVMPIDPAAAIGLLL